MSGSATNGLHPEIEEIAAFLDGRLAGESRQRMVAHLADCEDCYELFAETARFLREEEERPVAVVSDEAGAFVSAPIDGGARVLRPSTARWWRSGLTGATIATAAAVLAGVLVWTPAGDFLGVGAGTPTVGELATALPPAERVAPVVARTRERHGWPVPRGVRPAMSEEEERAFQIGVRMVEMDLALAAGDAALASRLTYDLEPLLEAVDLADPLLAFYTGELRGRLAADEAPAVLLDVHRRADDLLAGGDDRLSGLVDGFWYALGKWAGAAHLAAAARDAEFFAAGGNRRYLRRITRQELPEEVEPQLGRLAELAANDPERHLPELERELRALIAVAGGGDPIPGSK